MQKGRPSMRLAMMLLCSAIALTLMGVSVASASLSDMLEGSFSDIENIVYDIAPSYTPGSDGDPCGGIPPLPSSLAPDLALLSQEDEQQRSASSERDNDDGDDGGVHLHGVYRLPAQMMMMSSGNNDTLEDDPFSLDYHQMIIDVPSALSPSSSDSEDGLFRLRVAADAGRGQIVDLYLYEAPAASSTTKMSPTLVAYSIQEGLGSAGSDPIERHLVYTLKASTRYIVKFAFGFGDGGSSVVKCQSVLLELALQRVKNIPSFVNRICNAASNTRPPAIRGAIKPWDLGSDNANNNNNDENVAKSYYYGFNVDGGISELPTYWATLRDSQKIASDDTSKSPFEVVAKYPVTLPYISGRSQRWKFTAELSTRFLIGGDIALVVTTDRPAATSDSSSSEGKKAEVVPSIDLCERDKALTAGDNTASSVATKGVYCFYGQRLRKNTLTVETELWGSALGKDAVDGKFTLWIVTRRPAVTYAIAPPATLFDTVCAPYGLSIEIFPMPESENFVSCVIDPLPATFNVPGMYNEETGQMAFAQDVLVNTSKAYQEVTLRPSRPMSLLRVVVGAHSRVDVDVSLYERKLPSTSPSSAYEYISGSYGSYNEDGILFVVDNQHEYKLRLRTSKGASPNERSSILRNSEADGGAAELITNSNDDLLQSFCDSFDLRVFVTPLTSDTAACGGEASSGNTAPNFVGLENTLALDGKVSFGSAAVGGAYAFYHSLDNAKSGAGLLGKHTVSSWDFTLPPQAEQYQLQVVLLSDPVGGPLTIKLTQLAPIDNSSSNHHHHSSWGNAQRTYYGDQLGAGQTLRVPLAVKQASQSRFTLTIETPATQRAVGGAIDAMFSSTMSNSDIATATKMLPTCIGYNLEINLVSLATKNSATPPPSLPCPGLPFPDHFSPALLAHSDAAPTHHFGHVSEIFRTPPPTASSSQTTSQMKNIHYVKLDLGASSSSSAKAAPSYRFHAAVQETTVPMTLYLLKFTDEQIAADVLYESPSSLIQKYAVAVGSTSGLSSEGVADGVGAGGTAISGASQGSSSEIALLLTTVDSATRKANRFVLAVASHYEIAKTGLCAQTSLQMSLDPVQLGWKPSCDMTVSNTASSTLPDVTTFTVPADFKLFEFGPKSVTISSSRTESSSTLQLERAGITKRAFELDISRDSFLRATFEYFFPAVVLDAEVCNCLKTTSGSYNCSLSTSTLATANLLSFEQMHELQCTAATSYFNGQEIRSLRLKPGKYVINVKLRPSGVNSIYNPNNKDSAAMMNFRSIGCADVFTQIAIVPTSDPYDKLPATPSNSAAPSPVADGEPAPSSSSSSSKDLASIQKVLCPANKRNLPATLNDVSMLWKTASLGNGRMHFLMDVLIPQKSAKSVFKLTRKSVVRLSMFVEEATIRTPAAAFLMRIDDKATSSSRLPFFGYIPNAFASPVASTLAPGTYALVVARASYFSNALPCESVKIEMSVTPVEDIMKLSAAAARCTGTDSKVLLDIPSVFEKQIADSLVVTDGSSTGQCTMNPGPSESLSTVLFRDPRKTFSHNVTFKLGKLGGMVHFDIRYLFETEGIRAILLATDSSAASSSDSSWGLGRSSNLATAYPLTVLFNRVFLHRWLPAGDYMIILTGDAGMERSSSGASSTSSSSSSDENVEAVCVPLLVDLRVYPTSASTPAPSPGGEPPSSPQPTTAAPPGGPTLSCPWNTYTTLPTTLADSKNHQQPTGSTASSSASTTRISFSSSEYGIAYSKGTAISASGGIGGTSPSGYQIREVISLPASIPSQGIVIRVWGATKASAVSMAIQLEEVTEQRASGNTGIVPPSEGARDKAFQAKSTSSSVVRVIASAEGFLGGMATLTHWCSTYSPCGSNGVWVPASAGGGGVEVRRTVQMAVTITYARLPRYLTDFTTCDEKRDLETFSLSFNLLPEATLETIGHCDSKQKGITNTFGSDKTARLLTGTFHLGKSLLYSSREGFISDDDLLVTAMQQQQRGQVFVGQQAAQKVSRLRGARTDVWFLNKTVIEIPEGSSNVSMLFQAQYDSKLMDVYIALRQENNFGGAMGTSIGVTPIATAVGTPSWFGNNQFDATATLTITPYNSQYYPYLLPGRYFLEMRIHFTDPNWGLGSTEFCAPISSQILIYADKYATSETAAPDVPPMPTATAPPGAPPPPPTTTTPPTTSTPAPDLSQPAIIDFNPSALTSIDPSETLTITITLNKPAHKQFLRSNVRTESSILGWLEIDSDGKHDEAGTSAAAGKGSREGKKVMPDSVYFIDSTHVAIAWWSGSLEWQTRYRLYVDGTVLGLSGNTAKRFDGSAISHLSTSYTTGYCSCNRAGSCVGGGGCGCTEPNGETCSACDADHTLSAQKGRVPGMGVYTKFCLKLGQSLEEFLAERKSALSPVTPTSPTEAPSPGTNKPTVDDTRAPTSAPTSGPIGVTEHPTSQSPQPGLITPNAKLGSFMKYLGMFGVFSMFVIGGIYWVYVGMARIRGTSNGGPIAFNATGENATRSNYHTEHRSRTNDDFTLGDDEFASDDFEEHREARTRLTNPDGTAAGGDEDDDSSAPPVNAFDAGVRSSAIEMKAVRKIASGVAATANANGAHRPAAGTSSSPAAVKKSSSPSPQQQSRATEDFFADLDNDDFFGPPPPPSTSTQPANPDE